MEQSLEEALARIGDHSIPAADRRAILEDAMRIDRSAIAAARAQGRFQAGWPTAEQSRQLAGDDLFLLAVCMPTEAIAAVLSAAQDDADMDRLALAIRLAEAATRYDNSAAERFEPLLRSLLADTRPAFPWLETPSSSIGAYVQTLHLEVLTRVAQADPPRWPALIEATLRASLARSGPDPALYGVFETALRNGLSAAWLSDILNGVLGDPQATPVARINARKALNTLAGLATHPDGAPADLAAAIVLARALADAHPEGIVRDGASPASLRAAVLAHLHRWAPEVFLRLQREGVLATEPIPSRRQHKDWSPAGKEALAIRVSCDEAASLLAVPREEDIDRMITVLRIAHVYTTWLPGQLERFAPLFISLFQSKLPVPMKSGQRSLGDMALEQFPTLFPPIDSQTPAIQDQLCAGLEAAGAAGLAFDRIRDWLPHLLNRASLKKLRHLFEHSNSVRHGTTNSP